MRYKSLFILILVIGFLFCNLYSVEVKRNNIDNYLLFSKGQLKGTGLSSRGELFMSNISELLSGPNKEYYLAVDVAKNGTVYIGTGHDAEVYMISPDKPDLKGKVTRIFKAEQPDVYAVLVKNDKVFAATSPNGKIFEIDNKQAARVLFDPDEKFIWDMKLDKAGNIICAVGNGGSVYQITPQGQATKLFTSEDSHILTLYVTQDNSILAGSGDRGILYKIKNRKVKVLYNTPFSEIRGICEDSNRNVYFSGSKELFKKDNKVTSLNSQATKKLPKRPAVLEASALYCLNPNGNVERIWVSKDEYIYSISYDPIKDRIICTTGNSGRVYGIKKDGSFSIVFEGESAQVFKSVRSSDGFYLINNNTPSLLRLKDSVNSNGSYLSPVYDMKTQSKIGRVYWESEKENSGTISLFIRAGNSNLPDKTWSAWSPPFTDHEKSTANISGYRYFQVKINFSSTNIGKSPVLNSFKVYYIQSNQRPKLKYIKVTKSTDNPGEKTSKVKETSNKKTSVHWMASDTNNDKLQFSLFIRRRGDKNWILLKKNQLENKLQIDPQLFSDGTYLAKVIADDSLANPHSSALSDSLISGPFVIDSTAPELINFSKEKQSISFSVIDQTSNISQVFYSTDRKIWFPLFPVDSINDSKFENFRLLLPGLKIEQYIFIKAVDEQENFKIFQQEL